MQQASATITKCKCGKQPAMEFLPCSARWQVKCLGCGATGEVANDLAGALESWKERRTQA